MISVPRLEKIAQGDKSVTPRDAVEEKFASGGGGVLIATPGSENGSFVVNMPIAEVATAMEKGAKIAVYVESGGEPVSCTLLEFSSWSKSGGTMRIMAYSVSVDLTTEIYSFVGVADGNTTKFEMIPHS